MAAQSDGGGFTAFSLQGAQSVRVHPQSCAWQNPFKRFAVPGKAKNGRTRIRLGLRCQFLSPQKCVYVSIIHRMTTYCNNFVVLQIWTQEWPLYSRFQDLQSHYSGHKALYLVQNPADWKIRVWYLQELSQKMLQCGRRFAGSAT